MKLETPGRPHLTYCTNVHAGEGWAEVKRNVETHVTAVKRQAAPDVPFGVGLRLSGRAAQELLSLPGELEAFREMLRAKGLYVFTINGFPHGTFHGTRVKENVYLPDWLDDARFVYTERLATILASLLPDEPGMVGSISTVPGAYRAQSRSPADVDAMRERMIAAAASLHALWARTGKLVTLAFEPEPSCHFETAAETVAFFEDHLFSARSAAAFASRARSAPREAEEALRRHLSVCFDACHMALAFEGAEESLSRFRAAGIGIGKIQISAGLEATFSSAAELVPLRPFIDGVYLHQVVERAPGGELVRYLDLPEAIAAADRRGPDRNVRTWRIHFHVPVFRERFGSLTGTQSFLRDLMAIVRARPTSAHLEVETYTWDVLPEDLRRDGLVADIVRELAWVGSELAQ
jgi:sugar phosphate isomerase/epimerase